MRDIEERCNLQHHRGKTRAKQSIKKSIRKGNSSHHLDDFRGQSAVCMHNGRGTRQSRYTRQKRHVPHVNGKDLRKPKAE